MLHQNDFRTGGKISVWIGHFASESELDAYINLTDRFEKDFGFKLNERDMPETVVECIPKPVAELAKGFSRYTSYIDVLTKLAEQRKIEKANTMVVFFNVEYDPTRTECNPQAPLTFLGAVAFS